MIVYGISGRIAPIRVVPQKVRLLSQRNLEQESFFNLKNHSYVLKELAKGNVNVVTKMGEPILGYVGLKCYSRMLYQDVVLLLPTDG